MGNDTIGFLKFFAGLLYCSSIGLIIKGFHQMFAYQNYSSTDSTTSSLTSLNVNAYVGGDAYNYIINSERAVAWFVIALICVIIASAILIIIKLNSLQIMQESISKHNKDIYAELMHPEEESTKSIASTSDEIQTPV